MIHLCSKCRCRGAFIISSRRNWITTPHTRTCHQPSRPAQIAIFFCFKIPGRKLSHLTRSTYQMILESQLLHKIVKSLYSKLLVNNKVTILWGS